MQNIDSKIRPFGFYYCPFWRSGGSAVTFATKSANSGLKIDHLVGASKQARRYVKPKFRCDAQHTVSCSKWVEVMVPPPTASCNLSLYPVGT
jgi:hypothetical protein